MATESNMKISVSNYGPIAEAKDVELCPLTVLVGPSNTGKSYLAILIYALFHSFRTELFSPNFFFSRRRLFYRKLQQKETQKGLLPDTESVSEEINRLFEKGADLSRFSYLSENLQKYIKATIAGRINKSFFQEVSRCMAIPQDEVHLMWPEFSLNIESPQKSLVLRKNAPGLDIKKLDLSQHKSPIKKLFADKEIPKEIKREIFIDRVAQIIFSDSKSDSFYLPAGRTGIMQSHRAIAGALVGRAASAGIEDISIPTLSGIVSDFLKEIIYIDAEEATAYGMKKAANEIEKKILHGSIKLLSGEANQYPKFLYKQNGLEIPLLRSSSMVSELAPVVLFLKYKVAKNDLLIIEEPEAHLHPQAQRNIAKTIVQLVRSDIRVIITTHSDHLLGQLSNHILSATLPEPQRKEIFGRQGLFLDESEVGAYTFAQHKDGRTIVSRMAFDQESGLSPEDHNKVFSDMYNETAEILDKIEDPK